MPGPHRWEQQKLQQGDCKTGFRENCFMSGIFPLCTPNQWGCFPKFVNNSQTAQITLCFKYECQWTHSNHPEMSAEINTSWPREGGQRKARSQPAVGTIQSQSKSMGNSRKGPACQNSTASAGDTRDQNSLGSIASRSLIPHRWHPVHRALLCSTDTFRKPDVTEHPIALNIFRVFPLHFSYLLGIWLSSIPLMSNRLITM